MSVRSLDMYRPVTELCEDDVSMNQINPFEYELRLKLEVDKLKALFDFKLEDL